MQRDSDNFDKEFDKTFKRASAFAVGWFIFVALLSLAILGGLGFVAFKVLAYFGIL